MKIGKYAPDMKVVVGVVAAMYLTAIAFAFLPKLAPGAIAANFTAK